MTNHWKNRHVAKQFFQFPAYKSKEAHSRWSLKVNGPAIVDGLKVRRIKRYRLRKWTASGQCRRSFDYNFAFFILVYWTVLFYLERPSRFCNFKSPLFWRPIQNKTVLIQFGWPFASDAKLQKSGRYLGFSRLSLFLKIKLIQFVPMSKDHQSRPSIWLIQMFWYDLICLCALFKF